MADEFGGGQEFSIVDNITGDAADVVEDDGKKSLRIIGEVFIKPPTAAPGATQILLTEYDSVSTEDDTVHVITNGKTLVLQALIGSSEWNNVGGGVIELWYDPNGDGTGMTPISVGHCNGNNFYNVLNDEYTGDGTKAVRLRRKVLGGGTLEMFGRVFGYEI